MSTTVAIDAAAVALDPVWLAVIVAVAGLVGSIVTPLIGWALKRSEIQEQARTALGQQLAEREKAFRDALAADNASLRAELAAHDQALRECKAEHATTKGDLETTRNDLRRALERIDQLEQRQAERMRRENEE